MNSSIWYEIRQLFARDSNLAFKLIATNVLVFLFFNLSKLNFPYLILAITGSNTAWYYHFLQHLSLPASIGNFVLQPWSLLSYGFLHANFFHLVFNMLGMYILGSLLQEYLGNRKLARVYFGSIIAGGILFLGAYSLFPYFSATRNTTFIVGASGGVIGVLAATATLIPEYPLYIVFTSIRLKYVFLFYLVIDLLSLTADNNPGGHLSHLGGALFGFMYIRQLYKTGFIDRPLDFISTLFTRTKVGVKSTPKRKVVFQTKESYVKTYIRNSKPRQEEVDEILDKINQSGYESLTTEEKAVLYQASRDDE